MISKYIPMKNLVLFLLLLPLCAGGQEAARDKEGGKLQLGMRSTVSAFSDDEGSVGTGVGGQFRLRFAKKLNSEWFADYITTDIGGLARRYDAHIGWSVMFYPIAGNTVKGSFTPYILAGHCFDYTRISKNLPGNLEVTRWSSAVQAGLGTHYNITDRFDVALSGQYMMHLGKDIHAEIFRGPQGYDEVLITEANTSLEGHLLVTLSLNVYIADLWSR
jgi:opacity protein-like surface antigen